jgi:methanogenic corrinoid protein MtbC1
MKRWCDRGLIPTVRTAGGHRRLDVAAVLEFLRNQQRPLVRAELLGLPSNTGRGSLVIDRAGEQLTDGLIAGDEVLCRQIVFDLYLAGHPTAEIFDRVMAPAYHEIGRRWSCGDVEVFHERRACEIGLRIVHELRGAPASPANAAPTAIGGTPEADTYGLATSMAEIVLREAGWQATSLGSSLPFDTLTEAVGRIRPRLFWLSVSHLADTKQFLSGYAGLYDAAVEAGAAVAVGGQALKEPLRRRMQYSAYCDSLQDLINFAASLSGVERAPAHE